MQIIKFLLIIFALYFGYRLIYLFSKRLSLTRKIKKFAKKNVARVRFNRFPLASFIRLSKKADIILECTHSVYLIRTVSGGSGMRRVHFASREYFVSFRKFSLMPTARLRSMKIKRQGPVQSQNTATSGWRVGILPPLEIPDEYSRSKKEIVPVIIFNPAPNELSYVTEERTKIKLAFTGDEFYGYKIFTSGTFVRFAERALREKEQKTQNELSYFYG